MAVGGLYRFCFKSDQEPAIEALKNEVVNSLRERFKINAEIIPEESGVESSQSNGAIERAIWDVKSFVRSAKHRLEKLHAVEIKENHPILPWLMNGAGQWISRYAKRVATGKTAYEMRKGKHLSE